MTAGADPLINAPVPQEVDDYIETLPEMMALLQERTEIKKAMDDCQSEDDLAVLRVRRKESKNEIWARKQHYRKGYRKGHFRRRDQAVVIAQLQGHDCDAVLAASQSFA